MAFKRITFKKPEPVPIVDPAQLDLEQVIAEVKGIQLSDINVLQSADNLIGHVFTVGPFNPFQRNSFVLFLYAEQSEYGRNNGMYRVRPLNEDLSFKDVNQELWHHSYLDTTNIHAYG